MALDYGYTIRIQSNGTSDPTKTPTNQWQRRLEGQPSFEDLVGETKEEYEVTADDQSAEIRLKQTFEAAVAYSNFLTVTSDSPSSIPPVKDGIRYLGDINSLGNGATIGGTMAPDGKIYCGPSYHRYIHALDVVNEQIEQVADTNDNSSNKWSSGVLHPNGHIYFPGFTSNKILKYNLTTRAISYISVSSSFSSLIGAQLAGNGKIYSVKTSYSGPQIMILDPNDSDRVTGKSGLTGYAFPPCLHPDGNFYIMTSTGVWKYNPTYNSLSKINSSVKAGTTSKLFSSCLSPDGNKIFFLASNYSYVQYYDVEKDTGGRISGVSTSSSYNYWGMAQGPDDMLYSTPMGQSNILRIDPYNLTLSTIPIPAGTGGNRWRGIAAHSNGRVYGCPSDARRFVEINIKGYGNHPYRGYALNGPSFDMPGMPGDKIYVLSQYNNHN